MTTLLELADLLGQLIRQDYGPRTWGNVVAQFRCLSGF
jgi:hypothetical protein